MKAGKTKWLFDETILAAGIAKADLEITFLLL